MLNGVVVWLLAAAFFSAGLIALPVSRGVGLTLGAVITAVAVVTLLRRQEFSHAAPLGMFAALLVLAAMS